MDYYGFVLAIVLCNVSCEELLNSIRYKRQDFFQNDASLESFLKSNYEPKLKEICQKQVTAEWNYMNDLDDKEKLTLMVNETVEGAKFNKQYWKTYFRGLKPSDYTDINLKRQIARLSILGNAALDEDKLTRLSSIISNMTSIYSIVKLCPFNNQKCNKSTDGLPLNPDIDHIMANSDNYDELLYYWSTWRDETGGKLKNYYEFYIELSNEAARANNFSDKGELWRHAFESPNFINDVDELWKEIQPLYDQLHRFVYKRLKQKYESYFINDDKLIPAHLLGNMWAQTWINVAHLVKPFPNASQVDVTKELQERNYTPLKMFQTADEFYQSLGLESNSMSYDVHSGAMIEKPLDRAVLCHGSAWDFCNGKDFRIKMCTKVNFKDFIIIHHEMGHIQYYLLYKDQPIVLRAGANPGFHEAVGDTIALSVSTPQHLKKIGLLQNYVDSKETSLNALMDMALERISLLPYALIIDQWRWDIFSGKVPKNMWNSHWWQYRETVQKIKSPIIRSDLNDFDPGAKFHVAADSQYISYFVAHILEFQLHRALCIAAGQYEPGNENLPLHKCDIYGSKEAGAKLREGLSLGMSRHWSVVLEKITGEKKLSARAILEYFEPLQKYLENENK